MADIDWTFEEELQLKNYYWRRYRITGTGVPFDVETFRKRLRYFRRDGFPIPFPNPGPLEFFKHRRLPQKVYRAASHSGVAIDGPNDIDPLSNRMAASAQRRSRELKDYFGGPRYAAQKTLGYGGNGLATHFRDCGPTGMDDPGRDFVIKIALHSWQDQGLSNEKKMMKKVKGSAHCVQMMESQDIGKAEEEPGIWPLPYEDSSTDEGDSSGNESSTAIQVGRRHRVPKRVSRSRRYWERKRVRRRIRDQEIEQQIDQQENNGRTGKDYIIMEYLQHGSLANMIIKQNEWSEAQGEQRVEIPNRVLWGFWLCLIRGCIAMEYPPRKFHPLRKRPQPPQGAFVPYARAKANGLIRECKRLGIKFFDPETYARMEAEYRQLEGDLIENIPNPTGDRSQNWKRRRRQNMVHRDLDPTNILVGGFELDEPALLHWQEKQNSGSSDIQDGEESNNKALGYTGKRPDRLSREHELIPRLKEFFGQEWERVEGGEDGHYLADSRTCGYYSNKTNIWSIALTMWEMITKYEGPAPPIPQPPYDEVENYPPIPENGETGMDMIFDDPEYADFKISYCALLLDPVEVDSFTWVDETLRRTIFRCPLEELLREAEEHVQADFPGEYDDDIRDWIQRWFLDAAEIANPPQPQPQPRPRDPAIPPNNLRIAVMLELERMNDARRNNPVIQQLEIRFNADFPHGWDPVSNPAQGQRCGLIAIVDSLQHQLGLQPNINGVQHNLNSLPTADELLALYQQLQASGRLDEFDADSLAENNGNFTASALALILDEWGQSVNIDLELAYFLSGRGVMSTAGGRVNAKLIWIHNNNEKQLATLAVQHGADDTRPRGNHWKGLKAKPPPLADDDDDLPDYVSDE
ncbi:hypothetical protein GGR58DRAFT_525336 [Xylaria digitata]|nr:hypothetical protein GGR58DRAFT_525336 [Xylaria digitata]